MDHTRQFREFIAQAEPLLATTTLPVQAFREFVTASLPIVLGDLKSDLAPIILKLERIRPWLTHHDLLHVARIEYLEDSYTELIRWALAPGTHSPSALLRQLAWLRHLGILTDVKSTAEPVSQLSTDDGIPDLVLQFDRFTLVVEAKTGSDEHVTPSGEFQTRAYPEAVRRRLRLGALADVRVVFITPDRRQCAHSDAILTTYCGFGAALAAALTDVDLSDDLRRAYKMLITHFVTCALPKSLQAGFLFASTKWLDQLDESFLISNLSQLRVLVDVLGDNHK